MPKKSKKKDKTLEKEISSSTAIEVGKGIREIRLESKIGKEEKGKKTKISAFKAILSGEHVVSKDKKAMELHGQSHFGEIKDKKVYYSLIETLYLAEKGKINVYYKGKKLNSEKFFELATELEPNFFTRYSVFKDIRNRGYIVKTALKFGADFRVYARGIKPGQDHAKWVLFPVYETSSLTWHEFAAKNRVAHSTRKNLLIAVVDEEQDVTYYEIKWIRP
jgi:tRNA-intron endonuclease, archaea type